MDDRFLKSVFETACGLLMPEYTVPGVENMFASGKACQLIYKEVWKKCLEICEKMGIHPDDDIDLQFILNRMDEICWLVGCEMFRCGMEYQKGNLNRPK